MDLKMIFAVDENWGIGYQGKMLFHLPKELQYFRRMTMDSVMIMGRKTWEALGRPLEEREHYVLTRQDVTFQGAKVFGSVEELFLALEDVEKEIFVIGGAEVASLLYPWIQKAYITKIYSQGAADTYLMNLDQDKNFQLTQESDLVWEGDISYRHCVYERISSKE